MTMRPQPKYLFFLCGFLGDLDKARTRLAREFTSGQVEVLGRSYPFRLDKRSEYLEDCARDLVNRLMPSNSSNFCSIRGEGCVLHEGRQQSKRNACRSSAEQFACSRTRPRMIVIVASATIYAECVEVFGRCALLVRLDDDQLGSGENLVRIVRENLPSIEAALRYLVNLPANVTAAYAPRVNFQSLSGNFIYRDVQADISHLAQTIDSWHARLWLSFFKNARRKKMRGALILSGEVGFQKDRLHSHTTLGIEAKENSVSFLEAFYLYGCMITPGMHFDVTKNHPGGSINVTFHDAVSGEASNPRAEHVNMSPNDRVLG